MNKIILSSLAAVALGITAQAAPVTFNFLENGTGNLGATSTFTQNGLQIEAWSLPTGQKLYAKNEGGTENGLGIASDPNGDHEIYPGTYVQLFGLSGVDLLTLTIGSLQHGEIADIYASGTQGSLGTLIGTLSGNNAGSDQTFNLAAWAGDYITLGAAGTGGQDVLVTSVTAVAPSVPDGASTMMLLGSVLTGIGLIKRKLSA
jgi:hypothetical protein